MGTLMGLAISLRTISRRSDVRSWAFSRPLLFIIFLLAVALLLRLLHIDDRGLWSDEAYRVLGARQPTLADTLRVPLAQPPSAPFFYLALHIWVGLFGHADVTARLLSVPASVCTLLPTYALGRMAGGTATGILSAALLAIAPYAIETGQEADHYAWAALFATAAIWAAFSWLKTGRGAGLYIAFSALLLYAHYMGALLLLELLFVGLIWKRRDELRITNYESGRTPERGELIDSRFPVRTPAVVAWLKAHAVIALLWSPLAITMGVNLVRRAAEYSHLQHRAGLPELYGSFINMSVAASAGTIWPPAEIAVAVLTGGCLVLLALLLPRPREHRMVVQALAGIFIGFVLVIVATSAATGAWLVQPRFFTLVIPAALVVVASAVPFTEAEEASHTTRADGVAITARVGSISGRRRERIL